MDTRLEAMWMSMELEITTFAGIYSHSLQSANTQYISGIRTGQIIRIRGAIDSLMGNGRIAQSHCAERNPLPPCQSAPAQLSTVSLSLRDSTIEAPKAILFQATPVSHIYFQYQILQHFNQFLVCHLTGNNHCISWRVNARCHMYEMDGESKRV